MRLVFTLPNRCFLKLMTCSLNSLRKLAKLNWFKFCSLASSESGCTNAKHLRSWCRGCCLRRVRPVPPSRSPLHSPSVCRSWSLLSACPRSTALSCTGSPSGLLRSRKCDPGLLCSIDMTYLYATCLLPPLLQAVAALSVRILKLCRLFVISPRFLKYRG